jgi:L-rhamnose mutarotase
VTDDIHAGGSGGSRRRCFALDLIDEPELIEAYEARHAPGAAWPAVTAYIREQGVEGMEIWRTGDRLFMIAEVSEDYPRPVPVPEEVEQWEELMWRFQRRLPHARAGEKWVEMRRIFKLSPQGDVA